MKRSSRAFTLVELLVVIAIIAILIALLLPSLSKARYVANKVACGSNLHSILLATFNYAQDNKGLLPCAGRYNVAQGAPIAKDKIWRGYTTSWTYTLSSSSGSDNGYPGNTNAAMMVATKYLPTAQAFFCPAQPVTVTKIKGFPYASAGLPGGPSTHYNYLPHPGSPWAGAATPPLTSYDSGTAPAAPGTTNLDPVAVARWQKLNEIPSDRCVVMDVAYQQKFIGHDDGKGGASFNVGFADGSVKVAEVHRETDSAGGVDLYRRLKTSTGNTWGNLNDFVRVCELLANDQDPKTYNGNYRWGQNWYWPVGANSPNNVPN